MISYIDDEYMTYDEFLRYSEIETRDKIEYDNGFIHYMTPVFANHERVKQKIQLLIVEILSHSTKDRDLDIKLEVYEKFRVPEY